MELPEITVSTSFTPVTVTIVLNTQEQFDIFNEGMGFIGGRNCNDTTEDFDDICNEIFLTMN